MKQFYRNYTIINFFKKPILEKYENIKVHNNANENTLFEIKNYEIDNHFLYKGHILLFGKLIYPIEDILKHSLSRFNLYANHSSLNTVNHSTVDRSVVYCSSWVLPFIFHNMESNKSLYEACIRHRIQVETFDKISILL
jgi:hypothetical protein